MNQSAQALIDAYSGLDREEQKQFDRRHRELLQFRRGLNRLVKIANRKPKDLK